MGDSPRRSPNEVWAPPSSTPSVLPVFCVSLLSFSTTFFLFRLLPTFFFFFCLRFWNRSYSVPSFTPSAVPIFCVSILFFSSTFFCLHYVFSPNFLSPNLRFLTILTLSLPSHLLFTLCMAFFPTSSVLSVFFFVTLILLSLFHFLFHSIWSSQLAVSIFNLNFLPGLPSFFMSLLLLLLPHFFPFLLATYSISLLLLCTHSLLFHSLYPCHFSMLFFYP